jgi:starch phosphorylase
MLHVGDTLRITTAIDLGELSPDEVTVQAYYGPVDSRNHIVRSHFDAMELKRREPSGTCIYEREIVCGLSGRYGFTTRVTPAGNDWQDSMPGFVTWADDPA